MAVKERLITFIKYINISNSEFCRTIGVSNAFISSMRKSIQPDKIESIALHYPKLNTGWLMTGEGEMLRETENISEKKHTDGSINRSGNIIHISEDVFAMLRSQQDTIKEQQNMLASQQQLLTRFVNETFSKTVVAQEEDIARCADAK